MHTLLTWSNYHRGGSTLLMLVSLLACSEPEQTQVPPRAVRLSSVHYESISSRSHYSGAVQARYETPLAFQVAGKLQQRLVEVGSKVQAGQLLATLEATDYQIASNAASARLVSAQAELHQARTDLQHLKNLAAQELTSAASIARRQDQVLALQARVAEAKAGLEQQQRQFGYTELRALHSGVITAVDAEVGQVLTAGQSLLRLAQPQVKEVVINVPENRLADIQQASAIKISLWADASQWYPGKIREISPGVDPLIRTYTVKVSLTEANTAANMGMTATVLVEHAETQPAINIPLTALTQIEQQASVWVFDPNTQTVAPRAVTLAGYRENDAKITAGLNDNEQIVTAGVHKLTPGQVVRPLAGTQP